jgi:hypothetical protein
LSGFVITTGSRGAVVVGAADVGDTVVADTTAGTGFGGGAGVGIGLLGLRVVAAGTVVPATGTTGTAATDAADTGDTTTAGGVTLASSGPAGPRSVDAHAVVAATTTTATSPNPAHGSTVRIRLGLLTTGTIVVAPSSRSTRGTTLVWSSGPPDRGNP